MKTRIIKAVLYGVVLCIVAGAAISLLFPTVLSTQAELAPWVTEQIIIKKANGTGIVFHVELALTEEQQTQGLMNRPTMQEDHGMLFLFDDVNVRSFWMRNTLIPLDILFLNTDGTIHHIHPMAQPLDDKSFVSSGQPAAAVLEINGGLSARLGIAVGDKVQYKAFEG